MDRTAPASPPTLRCPACAFMTPLPATNCSRCGAHLGTGFIPVDEESENSARLKKWLIFGLAGLVLGLGGVLLGLAFFKTPPPASPASGAAATVDTIQSLSEQSGAAVGVRPDIVINRTKSVAGQVERNRKVPDQEEPD